MQHEHRSGALRQVTSLDACQGLLTCSRCHTKFYSWSTFRYHVQFVCHAHQQADLEDDLEHRLSVIEFMHYSNGSNFQALPERQDLIGYFKSHCILCKKFVMTARGMHLHWSSEHPTEFAWLGSGRDLAGTSGHFSMHSLRIDLLTDS